MLTDLKLHALNKAKGMATGILSIYLGTAIAKNDGAKNQSHPKSK